MQPVSRDGADITFPGWARADREGDLNVSRSGAAPAGGGGFSNLRQNAKQVDFVGAISVGDIEIALGTGGLRIVRDGKTKRLVEQFQRRPAGGGQWRRLHAGNSTERRAPQRGN